MEEHALNAMRCDAMRCRSVTVAPVSRALRLQSKNGSLSKVATKRSRLDSPECCYHFG